MSKRIKVLVAGGGLAALVIAIVAGLMVAGTVMAQTPPASGQTPNTGQNPQGTGQQFLNKLAENLGIGADKLAGAIKTTRLQIVDEAVQQGKLTQDQANQMKQRIQNSSDGFEGFGGLGMRGGHLGGHRGVGDHGFKGNGGQSGNKGSQTPGQQPGSTQPSK